MIKEVHVYLAFYDFICTVIVCSSGDRPVGPAPPTEWAGTTGVQDLRRQQGAPGATEEGHQTDGHQRPGAG